MKYPSLMTSTLSLMAMSSLLTVILCILMDIEIKGELLAVLTGIIGAYTGARNSNPPQYEKDTKGQMRKPDQYTD